MRAVSLLTIVFLTYTTSGIFGVQNHHPAEVQDFKVYYEGTSPRTTTDGTQILVTGFYHFIEIKFTSQPTNIELQFCKENSDCGTQNQSRAYSWKYINNQFYGQKYGNITYLDISRSYIQNFTLFFYAGVHHNATPGEWKVKVFEGTMEKFRSKIYVERYTTLGVAISTADFHLRVDPFKIIENISTSSEEYFRVTNNGNIPITVSVDFGTKNTFLRASNVNNLLLPGDTSYHNIYLNSQSWRPETISFEGTVYASITKYLPDEEGYIIRANVASSITGIIEVKRSGYQLAITPIGVVQYIDKITIQKNQPVKIGLYITSDIPTRTLLFSAKELNVEVRSITYNSEIRKPPFGITVKNDTEEFVELEVNAPVDGVRGYVNYSFKDINSKIEAFVTTEIIVPAINVPIFSPSSIEKFFSERGNIYILVAIILFLVVGLVYVYKIRPHYEESRAKLKSAKSKKEVATKKIRQIDEELLKKELKKLKQKDRWMARRMTTK